MVKAAVKEAAPKPNRSCDDDGASHNDAHGSNPPSLSLIGVVIKVFSRENCSGHTVKI
jgi:hypothetical protein